MSGQWVTLGPYSVLVAEGRDDERIQKDAERTIAAALEQLKQLGAIEDYT